MLNTIKIIKKISVKTALFVIFAIFFTLFFIKQSFALEQTSGLEQISGSQQISDLEIIDKIERTLLTSQGESITHEEAKIKIDRSDKNPKSGADIEVTKKIDDVPNRTKEKLAYNVINSGQYEVALEFYKQILKSEKDNSYAKFGLATSYHKLKQYKQAKQYYYELLSTDIENKNEVISNLLEILVEESPKDAKYILARLTSQSPDAHYILARTALFYDNLNNRDDAILLLKRAVSLNPNNAQYQMNLAIILDKNNESEEALKYYKNIVSHYINSGLEDGQIDLATIKKRIDFIEKELANNA